jgi:serine/threonine protein kinase
MSDESVTSFADAVRQLELVDPSRSHEFALVVAMHSDQAECAREAVHRGLLTKWQAQRILKGRSQELVFGSYVLLEQLGEGGMGKVYKARHRMMGRVVALKVIRRERMQNPQSVRRFQREIQAAAQLSHPNVVLAYDADQAGDDYFFAMEFVEGVDLGRLVKERGPLPLREACDYVRQAALGLQHAHERGLVHRDVKPSNLFLTVARGEAVRAALSGVLSAKALAPPTLGEKMPAVVKILDMGLARLHETATGEALSRITQEGLLVGTPDFVAPEQARNPSTVDIRADLYSLGCTLFYLLTAQVPYPEGTPTEKLLRHSIDPIPDVRTLRPEVPSSVAALIGKLMAKQPGDRYPTPAALAAALEKLDPESGAPQRSGAHRPPAPPITPAADPSTDSQFRVPLLTQARLDEERKNRRSLPRKPRFILLPIVLGVMIGLTVIGLLIAYLVRH